MSAKEQNLEKSGLYIALSGIVARHENYRIRRHFNLSTRK